MPQSYDDWVCGQFRDVEKEKKEMEEGRMEKISRRVYESSSDVNIWCTRLLQQVYENQDKLNEMVDEINTCYSILLKVQDWIVKHEKHSPKR